MKTLTTRPRLAAALHRNLAYYDRNAAAYAGKTSDLDLSRFYDRFVEHIRVGGHILDAGCGPGRDSRAFRDRFGFQVTAIDASPAMVREAWSRGVPARVLSFQELGATEAFDGIWACASLLHVSRAELGEVLRRFARALRPGGALFASVRQGEGESNAPDGRFFTYFQSDEFIRYARETGLEVLEAAGPDAEGWIQFIFRRPAAPYSLERVA